MKKIDLDFKPPFCPNSSCDFHLLEKAHGEKFFTRNGSYKNNWGPQYLRFKCQKCGHYFSQKAFHFNFRFKKVDQGLSAKIFKLFQCGLSNRNIGRIFQLSETCVRKRLDRMARWALLKHQERLQRMSSLNEAICYDGLENFAYSQLDINNINHAIGQDSLFIYDFNFAPLNRKGKMSARQKLVCSHLARTVGRFPTDAIRQATSVIIDRFVLRLKEGESLVLITDEHFQYKRSLKKADLKGRRIEHVTVSSKKHRDFQNKLFSVNHADNRIRDQIAAFRRETLAFSKTAARMCQKYALFMVNKNYMCPQFTKEQIRRPSAHEQSPAQALGLESHILKFGEFFDELRTPTQIKIPEEWELFIKNEVPYPRILPKA